MQTPPVSAKVSARFAARPPAPLDPHPVDWKRNLAVVWLTQFVSIAAFSFTLPLVPLYLKEAELVRPESINDYSAWFQTASSFSLMIMSPVWGYLGDRFGRKMMLVRANLGGAFALYAMGVVTNIEALLALRVFQGAFTGTTPAAQTLVSAYTPPSRQAFALGLMAAAIAIGDLAGRWFGGEVAAHWGVPFAFQISGVMLFLSTVLVWRLAQERFVRPARPGLAGTAAAAVSGRFRVARAGRLLARVHRSLSGSTPLMASFTALAFIMMFDGAMFSLFVDEIGRALPDTAGLDAREYTDWTYRTTSRLMAASGIASALAALTTGWVMDRWRGSWYIGGGGLLLGLSLLVIAHCLALPGWLGLGAGQAARAAGWVLPLLYAARIMQGFGFASVNSAQLVWTGRCATPERRGVLFGISSTARSLGWMLGPLAAAWIANEWGRQAVFVAAGWAILLLLPPLVLLSLKYRTQIGES